MINLTSLNCTNCPAEYLRDNQLSKIRRWEGQRFQEYRLLHEIKLYLLGESIPAGRFFYDQASKYSKNGLRYLLKKELVGNGTEGELFTYLRERGILLVDCAICPLHKLKCNNDKILSATFCLQRNTISNLYLNPIAPIITIFPKNRGFLKESLPNIQNRIIGQFQFSKLNDLKKTIENLLEEPPVV